MKNIVLFRNAQVGENVEDAHRDLKKRKKKKRYWSGRYTRRRKTSRKNVVTIVHDSRNVLDRSPRESLRTLPKV